MKKERSIRTADLADGKWIAEVAKDFHGEWDRDWPEAQGEITIDSTNAASIKVTVKGFEKISEWDDEIFGEDKMKWVAPPLAGETGYLELMKGADLYRVKPYGLNADGEKRIRCVTDKDGPEPWEAEEGGG